MDAYPKLIDHPGVHHVMFEHTPPTAEQRAWFEEACKQVETLIRVTSAPREFWQYLSFGVHLLADHLFDAHGAEVAWEKLDPDDFALLALSTGDATICSTAAALYVMLTTTGQIDRVIGFQLATILNDMTPDLAEWRPSRAERRRARAAARRAARRMN